MAITIIDKTNEVGTTFRSLELGDTFKYGTGNLHIKVGANKAFNLNQACNVNMGHNPCIEPVNVHIKVYDVEDARGDDDADF